MMEKIYSHCRGCVSSCGLVFDVANGKIVSHSANRDSLVSAGFKCVKGDMSVEQINGRESRILECLERQHDGTFTALPADILMDKVADRIRDSIESFGPRSVALYIGTAGYRKAFNNSMAKQMMFNIGSPSIFSTMTIDQSAHWVVEGRMGTFKTGRPFFDDVDVIVLSGTNPVISHSSPYLAVPLVNQIPKLRAYKQRGGKLIVVDPRLTETARQADLHIQPRPGFDTEIFACINHLILKNGLEDKAFIDRYATNIEALRAAVDPYTPEFVAERAGIPAQQIEAAARMIGLGRKVSAGFGTGTCMSPNANTAAHMIETLNVLRGGFTRAGDKIWNPGVFTKRATVEGVNPPSRSWEKEPKISSGHGQLYGEFPSSQMADEIMSSGPNRIRTLIVLGANPMMAFGEPSRLKEALQTLDCLIVIDPRMTETAELADFIVAPPLQYEVHDFNMANSGRTERPVVQYAPPVVEPPSGVLNEWEFFNGVSNRLGFVLRVTPGAFGFDVSKSSAAPEIKMDEKWTTERLIQTTFSAAGLSIAEVLKHPNGYPVFVSDNARASAPAEDDGARLDVCPPDVASELANVAVTLPRKLARYSLVVRRIVELMNSEFRFGAATQRRFPKGAPLYIHPDDMAQEGLEDGALVSVVGVHGRVRARTNADASLRRGVVAMTHSFAGDALEDSDANHTSWLVSMRPSETQKIDGMPIQSSLAVSLEPVRSKAGKKGLSGGR